MPSTPHLSGAEVVRLLQERVPSLSSSQQPRKRAHGVHKPGVMNKTEQAYADLLDGEKQAGLVEWWKFEGITFKLGPDVRYTPDFAVMLADGTIELRETKGHWEEDALIKIRLASSMFPFNFRAFHKLPKKEGGGWKVREF